MNGEKEKQEKKERTNVQRHEDERPNIRYDSEISGSL